MAFTSAALSDPRLPGVDILGLTQADIDSEEARARLNRLWIEHGLLIFRDVHGPDFQVALSEVFGTCEVHIVREQLVEGQNKLINLRYNADDGEVFDIGGKEIGGFLPWHSDLVYAAKISRGALLRVVESPEHGGETGFIDKIAAYERLPDELKREIEGLSAIYKFDLDVETSRFGNKWGAKIKRSSQRWQDMRARSNEYPRAVHPMVYTQRETGRKVLNVSPWFAEGIKGHEDAYGDDLLRRVIAVMTDERFAYLHHWTPGDMVLWDNWRMIHMAAGLPAHESRWVQRTTIYGDYGLGELEEQSSAKLTYIEV
jgi:taurine dioxygenase